MTDEQRNETLLQIYKLHSGAVDDVSRRRAMANRMYLAATTAIGITMGVVGRLGEGAIALWGIEAGLAVLGALVQLGWLGVIKSHQQLNEHKCNVLIELEKELPFDFYSKEWKSMKEGREPKVYLQTTLAEKTLPKFFFWAYIVAGAAAALAGGCGAH